MIVGYHHLSPRLLAMYRTTTSSTIGSWEQLVSVTFNTGTNSIVLESEEGGSASIPCADLAELQRLAKISYALAEGHSVRLEWSIPVLEEVK